MHFPEVWSTEGKGDLLRVNPLGENEQFSLGYVEFKVL